LALPRLRRALAGLRRALGGRAGSRTLSGGACGTLAGLRGALAGRGRARPRGGGAVPAEGAHGRGLVDGGGGGGHVEAGGAQLEQRVAGGHAAFLGDLVYALFCHQPFDSTRSAGTDTERRNARPNARRRIARARQSGPQT
jgi:hypothetical protein